MLVQMELDISFFGKIAGNHNIATQFSEASKAREKAVSTVFWNERMGQWLDYWLGDSSSCVVLCAQYITCISWCDSIALLNLFLTGRSTLGCCKPEPECVCFKFRTSVDGRVQFRFVACYKHPNVKILEVWH